MSNLQISTNHGSTFNTLVMNAPEFNAGLTNPETKYKQILEKLAQLEQIDVNILSATSQDTLTNTIALIESDLKNWSTVDDIWYNASMNEINDNINSLVAETYFPYSLASTVYNGITPYGFSGKPEYAITTKEDWLALTASGALSVDYTFHFTNDIDMQSIEMAPVCIDSLFFARIDGHGYVLKNVNITGAPTSDNASGVGLIGYYGGDSIQNLGIESGTIRCTGSATGCNIGAFVGCCKGPLTLKNCWNGATIYRDSTSGVSSKVAGLVGRSTSGTVTIDNCYNLGDIITDVNAQVMSFMSAWDRVHVYNSFNIGKMHGNAQFKFTAGYDTTDICNYISTSGADMKINGSGTVAATYNNFTDDDYSNGKLAYTLNTNYTTGKGTRGYYTVQNNRTVFGNSNNQTTIVTIGSDTYYWNTNSVHDLLDLYPGHTFSIDTSTGGSLSGSILTVGLEMHILIN